MDYFKKLRELNEWSMFVGYLESQPASRLDKAAIRAAKKVCATGDLSWIDQMWPLPIYKQIKKYRNSKIREVYYYPEPYQTVLKLLNHIIVSDETFVSQFSNAALAYIPGRSVKQAVNKIQTSFQRGYKYYFKTDFTDYFNSISVTMLQVELRRFFDPTENEMLLNFFKYLLENREVIVDGQISIKDNKGAMAGLPLAGLWANVYMSRIDHIMSLYKKVKYFRYADDVLILYKDQERGANARVVFTEEIRKLNIMLSEKKTKTGEDETVFLGFEINKHSIKVSRKAIDKLKSSMLRRRKWYSYQADGRLYNNKKYPLYKYLAGINQKLYTRDSEDGTAWLEWYANAITNIDALKELDIYLLKQCGKLHGKKNYETFKKLGYRSLVNEHYRFKNNRPKVADIA